MATEYPNSNEIVPGVFVTPGEAVYIVDDKGEVVTWNADEAAADPEAFTAALAAVALAASEGAGAVRDNIGSNSERLRERIEKTLLKDRMQLGQVPLSVCPYCGVDDVEITDHRPEVEGGKELICQDMECLTCKRIWTIEYRPVQWFGYDEQGNFDETPRPL